MQLFDCECDWRWIVGKKNVYGPIYNVTDASHAGFPVFSQGRMVTRERWEELNGDCAERFKRRKTS